MERIPPSQKIDKKRDDLLSHGLNGEGDVTSSIVRLTSRLQVKAGSRPCTG